MASQRWKRATISEAATSQTLNHSLTLLSPDSCLMTFQGVLRVRPGIPNRIGRIQPPLNWRTTLAILITCTLRTPIKYEKRQLLLLREMTHVTDRCYCHQWSEQIPWLFSTLYLLKYSRRFDICDTVTTSQVRIRRVFVWRFLGSMEVEATACMSERLGASEMFWEDSRIRLGVLKVWI